jgi:hypothetical protein
VASESRESGVGSWAHLWGRYLARKARERPAHPEGCTVPACLWHLAGREVALQRLEQNGYYPTNRRPYVRGSRAWEHLDKKRVFGNAKGWIEFSHSDAVDEMMGTRL